MTRVVALMMAALLVAGCGSEGNSESVSAEGAGETIELTLAVAHPELGITYAEVLNDFFIPELQQRVDSETPHTLDLTSAFGGTIAGHAEMLEATESKRVDIGAITYLFHPSTLYLHNFSFYVPFVSPDYGVVVAAARKTYEANPELQQIFGEEYGQRLLGLFGCGNYDIAGDFPIRSVDDLDGRKIGGGGSNLRFVEPFGATPVQQVLPEVYTNLQTGVYEATILPRESIFGYKLYEQAPYYNVIEFGAAICGDIHINNDSWDELPEDVQRILEEVGLEYEQRLVDGIAADSEEAMTGMAEAGIDFIELSEEERIRWAEGLPNLPNEAAQEAESMGLPGARVIADYIKFLEEEGYEHPREWPIDGS